MRHLLLILALIAAPALAQQRQVVTYKVSSGTGFVVNNEGHVVTNAHVVQQCQSISILTPKGEMAATLVAEDTTQDLAVLKTAFLSPYTAPLRWNISELQVGDPVVIMGYPGQQGATGRYEYKKTRVSALKGPTGEDKWIQLKSVAAHGNSGGPVLDGSGNVIAVISGTAMTYKVDQTGAPVGQAIGQSDVAITLAALEEFLRAHAVGFYQSGSNSTNYSDGVLRDNARNFTVPVRCIQDVMRKNI